MHDLVSLDALDRRFAGLVRPEPTRLTSGLSRALATNFQVDVVVVRACFVIFTIFTGIGLPAYLWGSLLTPSTRSPAPLRRTRFAQWPPFVQLAIIATSSLIFAAVVSASLGPAYAVLVILACVAGAAWYQRSRTRRPQPANPAQESSQDSVAEWRARMQEAAGLPEIDLDSPAPSPSPQQRTSWWGGIAVIIAGLGATSLALLLGIGDSAILPLVAGALASGTVLLVVALLRRRVPGLVLGLCAVMAIVCAGAAGSMATGQDWMPLTTPADSFTYVDADDVVIDLRQHDSGPISINLVDSEVEILLPRNAEVTVVEVDSDVSLPDATSSRNEKIHVVIRAVDSHVTGRHE